MSAGLMSVRKGSPLTAAAAPATISKAKQIEFMVFVCFFDFAIQSSH